MSPRLDLVTNIYLFFDDPLTIFFFLYVHFVGGFYPCGISSIRHIDAVIVINERYGYRGRVRVRIEWISIVANLAYNLSSRYSRTKSSWLKGKDSISLLIV